MQGTLMERMLPAPINGGFKMEGYWVWCGSVVKGEDGRYHMFSSRWPKDVPMHPGWLLRSEVVRASADTPVGPFQFEEVILSARGAQYWDGLMAHCPMITKQGDTYVLYYTGTTHPFAPNQGSEGKVTAARANKRIGILTSKSVFGPWERREAPIMQTRPGYFDNFLLSNPAPCVLEDGQVYLMYKTRSYSTDSACAHSHMMFGMARADSYAGPYRRLRDTPVFPENAELEDPFIWHEEDGFHMMAKDMIGNLERPFILFEDGKPTHVYFATSDGDEETGFVGAQNTWNMVIPLKQD